MKKSLLIAILLLPLAFAKATPDTRILPIPECFPCEPDTPNITAATRILPIPECFPCEPDTLNIRVATMEFASPVRALRREV